MKNKMKGFNKRTFLLSTAIIGLLLILLLNPVAWAGNEDAWGNRVLFVIRSELLCILLFPAGALFSRLFSLIEIPFLNWILFFVEIILDCLFYGLVIERSVYVFRRIKSKS